MRPLLILGLAFICFSSCSKDESSENEIPTVASECFGESVDRNPMGSPCEIIDLPIFCEIEDWGTKQLSDGALDFVPYFCDEVFTTSYYKNGKGEQRVLQIKNKYFEQQYSVTGYKLCEFDSSRFVGACFKGEVVVIEISNILERENYQIYLSESIRYNQNQVETSDFLIIEEIFNRDSSHYLLGTEVDRTDQLQFSHGIEYYESYPIRDKVFTDVIFAQTGHFQGEKQVYYSKQKGIVAYREGNGELWVLEE